MKKTQGSYCTGRENFMKEISYWMKSQGLAQKFMLTEIFMLATLPKIKNMAKVHSSGIAFAKINSKQPSSNTMENGGEGSQMDLGNTINLMVFKL